MSSVDYLREFVNERLTAAAEEIFRVFKQTVVEYEEEIDRQRRLLDNVWKPEVEIRRIELPQQHVCKEEEEVLTDHQLCNQERNSSLDQEEPETLQIKEEQEELCTSQGGEQLVLKQEETDTFMLTPTREESDHSAPEPNTDCQLFFYDSHVAALNPRSKSQDPEEGKYGDSASRESELKQNNESRSLTNNIHNPTTSKCYCNINTCTNSLKCDTCGKEFSCKSVLQRHQTVHTGEKPYPCDTCGKRFTQTSHLKTHIKLHIGHKPFTCRTCGRAFKQRSDLKVHTRIHTGEKPYLCKTCGERFRHASVLNSHIRTHTDEKPYFCNTCGKRFSRTSYLKTHIKIHMSQKPFTCKTCGRAFKRSSDLKVHMRIHTGEKPYSCDFCGKTFSRASSMSSHIRIHTGEKPYSCETCGKRFIQPSLLNKHRRVHTGEKPYSCETCGKVFKSRNGLKKHTEIHTGEKPLTSKDMGELSDLVATSQPT